MPHLMRCLSILLLFAVLPGTPAVRAQAGRSEITGVVRDQRGALVPQGEIRVTEISTKQAFTASVGDTGTFTITNLKPGNYTVTVEAPGFKRYLQAGVQLATGERARLDITLEAGQLSESVSIVEDASPLRTESGSLGQIVSNRKIVGMSEHVCRMFNLTGFIAYEIVRSDETDARVSIEHADFPLESCRHRDVVRVLTCDVHPPCDGDGLVQRSG